MDYSNFLFNPFNKSTLVELEKFPEFQFSVPHKDKVIAFMCIMWDVNNHDLRKLYPDYFTRKREAALLAGLKTDDSGHFPPEVEDLLVGKNDFFNTAVIRYLMMFGLPDYPALMALKELQARELEAAFSPSDAKDRKIIRENMDKSTLSINEYESRIFGGMEVENVRKALYKHMEQEKIRLRPEHIARDIKDKKVKIKDYTNGKA